MLDKTYSPASIEAKQYARWEEGEAFVCGQQPDGDPYTIVIPPPNITGSLHMGHALNNTLQDVLIRYRRMQGRDALWQPGTDHAGIATQMVVERQLGARHCRAYRARGNRTRDREIQVAEQRFGPAPRALPYLFVAINSGGRLQASLNSSLLKISCK